MPHMDFNWDSYEYMICHLHYQCKCDDGIDFTPPVCTTFVETREKKNSTNPTYITQGKIMKRLSFPLTKCESGLQESHSSGLQQSEKNNSELGRSHFELLPDSTSNIPFAVLR